jgi:hypothetical protein
MHLGLKKKKQNKICGNFICLTSPPLPNSKNSKVVLKTNSLTITVKTAALQSLIIANGFGVSPEALYLENYHYLTWSGNLLQTAWNLSLFHMRLHLM